MAFAVVGVGTVANDGTGDTIRTAMQTVNANFLLAAPLAAPAFTGTATFAGVASFSAGAAATPAIARTGDLDTGVWFPSANIMGLAAGGADVGRVTATGLSVNVVSAANFAVQGTGSAFVVSILNASAGGMFYSGLANCTVASGENAGLAMFYIRKDNGTSRSINAAGTINASGADYAEYERKAVGCGAVAKGQIIGFDDSGHITDKWESATSRFAVKSTDPSYVGGDSWGSESALGVTRPTPPIAPEEPSITASGEEFFTALAAAKVLHEQALAQHEVQLRKYNTAMDEFAAQLEVARQGVDRVAYAGKCPCNVLGASVGDYIIPVQSADGIAGRPISSPTFDEYRLAVGRVVSLLPDGRCTIAVITH